MRINDFPPIHEQKLEPILARKKYDLDQNRQNMPLQHYEEKVRELFREKQQRMKEYTAVFLQAVREASAHFIDSPAAKEVFKWITQNFITAIKDAQKDDAKEICVPLAVSIFIDKILSNGEVYDFRSHQCASLNTPLEQTALAVAIATVSEINVRTAFSQNISETGALFDVQYMFTEKYPTVTITYIAETGRLQCESIKVW